MKTLDLSKITITFLNGETKVVDTSKELAQAIFQNTRIIAEHNLALEIYKNPVIELTEGNINTIKFYAEKEFRAFGQVAINSAIEAAMESQKD